jgi:hypothetical protein
MNPLVHTMEARFHGAANASALRALHQRGDMNGLLEYALLLAESEASSAVADPLVSARGV